MQTVDEMTESQVRACLQRACDAAKVSPIVLAGRIEYLMRSEQILERVCELLHTNRSTAVLSLTSLIESLQKIKLWHEDMLVKMKEVGVKLRERLATVPQQRCEPVGDAEEEGAC